MWTALTPARHCHVASPVASTLTDQRAHATWRPMSPRVNAAAVSCRISALRRADQRTGGRQVACPPLTSRQGRVCSRRVPDVPIAAANGEAPRGAPHLPRAPRNLCLRLEIRARLPRDSCPCIGIRANHLRIRATCIGICARCLGINATASGFVPVASVSVPLPRDRDSGALQWIPGVASSGFGLLQCEPDSQQCEPSSPTLRIG